MNFSDLYEQCEEPVIESTIIRNLLPCSLIDYWHFRKNILSPFQGRIICWRRKQRASNMLVDLHAVNSRKTLVNLHHTTWHHIWKNCTHHSHHDEDLKFHILVMEYVLNFCSFTNISFGKRAEALLSEWEYKVPCLVTCTVLPLLTGGSIWLYLECIMVINKSWYFCNTQQASTATAVKDMIVMYNTVSIRITTI